jgi:hypothetical protein
MSKLSGSTFISYEIDNIYLNVTKSNETNAPIQLNYLETFDRPILDVASNFIFTVVRLKVPSSSIPIFLFEDNSYYVTIEYPTGTYFRQVVQYIPQSNATIQPDNRFIFNYTSFVNMVNQAIENACQAAGIANQDTPFITFNPITKLFSIFASTLWVMSLPPNLPKLYFNAKLYNFFSSFQAFQQSYVANPVNDVDYCNFQILFESKGNNWHPAGSFSDPAKPYATVGLYEMIGEYDILFSWTDAARIILISQSFPNNPENISSRTLSGLTINESILVDFEIGTLPTFKEYIFFENNYSYPLRWQNLLSNNPLRTFGFTAFWQTNDGLKFPLFLNPLYEMSIKMQFTRKPSTYGFTHLPQTLVQIPDWELSKTTQDKDSLKMIKTGKIPDVIAGSGHSKRRQKND